MAYSPYPDIQPFGSQELAFHLEVSAVAAQPAAGGNDAVTGNARVAAVAHHRADGPGGARRSGQRRDVAVGRDPAGGDPADRRQDSPPELASAQPRT